MFKRGETTRAYKITWNVFTISIIYIIKYISHVCICVVAGTLSLFLIFFVPYTDFNWMRHSSRNSCKKSLILLLLYFFCYSSFSLPHSELWFVFVYICEQKTFYLLLAYSTQKKNVYSQITLTTSQKKIIYLFIKLKI